MIDNENISGKKEVDTETETGAAQEENTSIEKDKEDKLEITTEKLNSIVRERLEKDRKAFFKRYGVSSTEELDTILGKAENSDVIASKYEKLANELNELKTEKLFNSHDVREDRMEDIKFYFKGKGIELNKENLEKELATHKEWLTNSPYLETLGADKKGEKHKESDKELAERLYGVKF